MILEQETIPVLTRKSGRTAEPNPFIDGEFADAIKNMPVDAPAGQSGALVVRVPGINDLKANKEFAKVVKQIRDAGAARGVTMRQIHTAEKLADGTMGVKIKFWAIALIVRMTKAEKVAKDAADKAAKDAAEQAEADALEPNDEGDDEVAAPAKPVATRGRRTTK